MFASLLIVLILANIVRPEISHSHDQIRKEVTSFQIFPDTDPAELAKEKCFMKHEWCSVLAEASIQLKMSMLFGTPLKDWKWNQYCK